MTFNPPIRTIVNTTPPTWPFPTSSADWEPDYRLRLLESAMIWLWANSGGGGVTPPVTITGTNPATIPLQVIGAPSQIADVFDVTSTPGLVFSITASGNVSTLLNTLDDGGGNAHIKGVLQVDGNLGTNGDFYVTNGNIHYEGVTQVGATGAYSPAYGEVSIYNLGSGSGFGTDVWTLPTLIGSNTCRQIIVNSTFGRTIQLTPAGGNTIVMQGGATPGAIGVLPGYTIVLQQSGTTWQVLHLGFNNGGRNNYAPNPVTSIAYQTDLSGEVWCAKAGVMINGMSGGWARCRDVFHIQLSDVSTAVSYTSSGVLAKWDTANFDKMGIGSIGGATAFSVPIAGIWRFNFRTQVNSTALGQSLSATILQNGTAINAHFNIAAQAAAQGLSPAVECIANCLAGDSITFQGLTSTTLAAILGAHATFYEASYLGSYGP